MLQNYRLCNFKLYVCNRVEKQEEGSERIVSVQNKMIKINIEWPAEGKNERQERSPDRKVAPFGEAA